MTTGDCHYPNPGELTYRQAWEWFIEPLRELHKKLERETQGDIEASGPYQRKSRTRGGFDPSRATKAEFDTFLDKFCGDRVWEGPKFWEPEVQKQLGIKVYNGRDD